MYEAFRNEFMNELTLRRLDCVTINTVLGVMDSLMTDYSVSKVSKELVLYEGYIPKVLNYYLASKAVEGQTEISIKNRRAYIVKFFERVRKPIEDVNAMDCRAFLFQYKGEHNLSDRTLEKLRSTLCAFFTWCVTEEYLEKNPFTKVSKIKYERKQREPVTQNELEYLRKACATKQERCVLELLYSTGCRISELLALKKIDINLEKKTVLLHGKGKKERISYLNAKAEIALSEYMRERMFSAQEHGYIDDNPYVIIAQVRKQGPLSRSGGARLMKRIADRAKEHLNKPVSAHIIRHCTAQTALDNGMPIEQVSTLLGHAQLSTTQHYVIVDRNKVQLSHAKTIM